MAITHTQPSYCSIIVSSSILGIIRVVDSYALFMIHIHMIHFCVQLRQRQHPIPAHWVCAMLALWVVTLALLNPLLCLLHCEILHAPNARHHDASSLYVCDMVHSTESVTLTAVLPGAVTQIPLSIYPGVHMLLAGLFLALVIQRFVVIAPHRLLSHPRYPVTPPPKHVSFV